MHNQPLKLSDLIALQAENAKALPHLKSVTRIKPLDQIPIPNIPQPAGGKRKGAGRPATAEPTKVIRVPLGCAAKVETLIREYKLATENPKYEIELDGVRHVWSGEGIMPIPFLNYIFYHGATWREDLAIQS